MLSHNQAVLSATNLSGDPQRRFFQSRRVMAWSKIAICVALFLAVSRLNAQITLLSSYGQGGQDAGIDVIQLSGPVETVWSQSISCSDVSITAGLASFGSSGTGWATVSSGAGLVASTDFDYPIGYGRVDLFDDLNLQPGTFVLNVGAFSGSDDGWGGPAEGTLYAADHVTYDGTFTPTGGLSLPVDFSIVGSIVSVPDESSALGLLAVSTSALFLLKHRTLTLGQP